MGNCNCKPCKKEIKTKPKKRSPFSLCVGGKTLVYDGENLTVLKGKFTIPDGTYTAITFTNGCITDVGQAPVAQYTPTMCCGGENTEAPPTSGESLVAGNGTDNLATINHGEISVTPHWKATNSNKVTGSGTINSPWGVATNISTDGGNLLTIRGNGLFAGVKFKTSDTISISGDGTTGNPYTLNLVNKNPTISDINKEEIIGGGYKIDKKGRVHTDENIKFITKIKFDNDAFSTMDAGDSLVVHVDDVKFKTGVSIKTSDGIKGVGTDTDPLRLEFSVGVVGELLDMINSNAQLKAKFRAIVGG